MSDKKKLVLFLGNVDREGVTEKLQAMGVKYKRKMLESSPDNWRGIIELFDNHEISSIIVKLTNTTFSLLCSEEYSEYTIRLLEKISKKPNLFLAHESLITGIASQFHKDENHMSDSDYLDMEAKEQYPYRRMSYSGVFEIPNESTRNKVISLLDEYDIALIPYQKNIELGIIASSFINQSENHLIFKIYIPSERIWANEVEKLLQLFRDYLHKVSGLEVKQDKYNTNQGIVYEFFGQEGLSSATLSEKFNEFSNFMDVCSTDTDKASALLESKSLNKLEVFKIVERYSKEARRLHVDLKQEREIKILTIRHQLESELAEYVRTEHDWQIINRIVDSTVPQLNSVGSTISIGRNATLSNQNLTINVNPQIIGTINGVVAQQINGDQHLGTDAKKLLEIIDQYAERQKAELTSALYELTDKGVKESDRVLAKSKLKGFLLSIGSKIGDVAAGVLQTYIERQIGL